MSQRGYATCFAITGVLMAGVLATCWQKVHTLEYALDYDMLAQTVSKTTISSGLHFLGGPWHRLIRFPGTLQNMQFSTADSPHDELHARTADGLQVVLEVSFQYQLLADECHALYQNFGEEGYLPVYFDVASHLVSEDAVRFQMVHSLVH